MSRSAERRKRKSTATVAEIPRSRFARWRAASLILVYVLMVIHVVHWLIAGKTLAPLELNEVMYTFELGIVTAGFLFMALAMIATAIFGRFFCSWGCHILALQDLCAWLLQKLHIRPKPVRSRALLWVPMLTMLYMFVWPQVVRVWEGRALPRLHLANDAEGWASFSTTEFMRNLPGPGIAILTFLVCGFAIVYVLGSRGFCTYGCPYGALFGIVDRFAPGRIRARDNCGDCGICTAVCGSHVRVHEEIGRYGTIVNPKCLKDLDCVSACPDGGLYYGFGRPPLFRSLRALRGISPPSDFSWWEEVLMAVLFLATVLIFRGLYDRIPFLMSLGMGIIVAYLFIVGARLLYRSSVRLGRRQLKLSGHMQRSGVAYSIAIALFAAFAVHSALIKYHTFAGARDYHLAEQNGPDSASFASSALAHLGKANRWGFLHNDRTDRMAARLYESTGSLRDAERSLLRLCERNPGNLQYRLDLAAVLRKQNKHDAAIEQLRGALRIAPDSAAVHYDLAGALYENRQNAASIAHLQRAVEIDRNFGPAHFDLGGLLIESGEPEEGVAHLRRAVELQPDVADGHYNLAVALAMLGLHSEARAEIDRALELNPDDPQTRALRSRLHSMIDRTRSEPITPTNRAEQ